MISRKADCFLYPGGMSPELDVWRAQHYHILMGCIDGTNQAVEALGRKAMAYINPDPLKPAALKWIEDFGGWKKYVTDKKFSGVQIDCVFQHQKAFGISEMGLLAHEIAPLPIIPNFGDFWNWSGGNPATKDCALALGKLAPWHFVQVGYDMAYHTEQSWRTFRAAVNLRLAAGKTLIMGMYDLGRKNELMAAYLMSTFQHENLIWHYKSKAIDDDSRAMWNPYWGLEL